MSRAGKDSDRRVKTGRGRTASSVRWLERQLNDPYVKQAKAEGYRSRAAYKLIELDDRFGLVKGAKRVVDLGIAPGGWSQVVRKRSPKAAVAGIDLLETEPIAIPIENITRNRLATSLLESSTFFASGRNCTNSTAPTVQKKLIATIA